MGNVTVLCLQGSHYEMGLHYGKVLKTQLLDVLSILKDYYITQQHFTYEYLATLANYWHYRYSYNYRTFIEGIANATGLSLQDAKILNGMVIYGVMQHRNYCPGGPNPNSVAQEPSPGVIFVVLGACAFGYIPPKRSETVIKGKGFALRNYDFPYPFYNISKYIVTTILVENDKSPTAFISMPGQIYCQNCINSHEIFMELNNGGPSGGFCINPYRRGLLIDMLMYMQNSDTFWELDFQLRTTNADVALIIGMATAAEAKLYETTAYIGSKTVAAPIGEPLISTNFFQNNTWMETLPVSDATTWHGITRWDNLQRLIHSRTQHNLQSLQTLWITPLSAGGAQWNDTIYQLLYDFSTGDLHVNNVKHGAGWTNIPLRSIFATVPKSISEPRDPSWNL